VAVAEPPTEEGMPIAEPATARMDRESIVVAAIELTRLPDHELDEIIIRRTRTTFGITRAFVASVKKLRIINPAAIFRRYRKIKNAIIAAPGRGVGIIIRWGTRDGGRSFCIRIRYCKRKLLIKEQLEAMGEFLDDAEVAKEALAERAPDLLEVSVEIVEEISDWVSDALLIPLLAKAMLYGLDDLCPCCRRCGGSGKTKAGRDCRHCEGTGQQQRQ